MLPKLESILARHKQINNDLHTRLGQRTALQKQLADTTTRLAQLAEEGDSGAKASVFLQTLADTTRQEILDRISGIVTDALQKIKGEHLVFKMLLSVERNQMDVKFFVYNKHTEQAYDIITSYGGTIADVVSFPLKLSLLVRWQPALARILIMDENFKFVSQHDQPAVAEFVRQVCEKLNTQVILVTHSPAFAAQAHREFTVSQDDKGISHVTQG